MSSNGHAPNSRRAALPDTGLPSVAEMLDPRRCTCDVSFDALRDILGFDAYDAVLARCETGPGEQTGNRFRSTQARQRRSHQP